MKHFLYKCDYNLITLSPKQLLAPPHAHEGVELTFILGGESNVYIDGIKHVLKQGDVLVNFPNAVHWHDDYSKNLNCFIILFPVSTLPQLKKVFLTKKPSFPIIKNIDNNIINLIVNINTYQGELKNEVNQGLLLTAVSMLLDKLELTDKPVLDNKVNEIFNFCDENYNKNLTIEEVAKHLYISKAYVSYIFSKILKINFRTYINSIRLGKAIKMLTETNLSITEIAFESGFESIRTFNRVFKNEMKVTPLQYKKHDN